MFHAKTSTHVWREPILAILAEMLLREYAIKMLIGYATSPN